jgi:hypothetical protein
MDLPNPDINSRKRSHSDSLVNYKEQRKRIVNKNVISTCANQKEIQQVVKLDEQYKPVTNTSEQFARI